MPRHTQNKEIMLCARALMEYKKMTHKIVQKDIPRIAEELDDIALSTITAWYASYEPQIYRRQMSLKHAYRVTLNSKELKIEFDHSFLLDAGFSYHQRDAEIIYNNAFVGGYHGGSWGTDSNGIEKQTPYWRRPVPEYSEWGRPAIQTFSPYEKIIERANVLFKKESARIDKEIDNQMNIIEKHFYKVFGIRR